MGMYQQELERQVSSIFSSDMIQLSVLRHVIRSRGLELTEEQMTRLNDAFTTIRAGGSPPENLLPEVEADLTITNEDIEAAAEHFTSEITTTQQSIINKLVNDTSPEMLKSLYRDAPDALRDRRLSLKYFQRNLAHRWRGGLNRLEMMIMIAQEHGQKFAQELKDEEPSLTDDEKRLANVFVQLHVKACRIASEVLCLLNGGHADGANARWRSLYELAVVANFIAQRKGDLPERYLSHAAIERWKSAQQFQAHCLALGETQIEEAEFQALERAAGVQIQRYGPSFGRGQYGWAAEALNPSPANFAEIERATDLQKWRPYYKMACHPVHAGAQGLIFCMGLPNGAELLAGASNAGLSDPGQCTCISLALISAVLFLHRTNLDNLIICKVLQLLSNDAQKAFFRAHRKLEREITRHAPVASNAPLPRN